MYTHSPNSELEVRTVWTGTEEPMRTLIIATAMLVCAAATPAQAGVIFTLTFGTQTSPFDGTVFSAGTFSFTTPSIPTYPNGASGYTIGGSGSVDFPGYAGDFTGATLNGLPVPQMTVNFTQAVGYAYLEYFSPDSLPLGALGGIILDVPVGLDTDLTLGTYNNLSALRFQETRFGITLIAPAAPGSLTITDSGSPEPASVAFAVGGLLGLALFRRRASKT